MQQALFILLGALAVLVLGFFIFSLYLPSRVRVQRSLVTEAPASIIFPYVNALRKWPDWSPWHAYDPAMEMQYTANDTGAGAGYAWRSRHRNVGKGSLFITESRPNEYLATEMNFMRQGTAKSWFRLEAVAHGTRITWGMEADMGQNPMRRLMGRMMDKWVGPDFEKGLVNLKRVSEAAMKKERINH